MFWATEDRPHNFPKQKVIPVSQKKRQPLKNSPFPNPKDNQ